MVEKRVLARVAKLMEDGFDPEKHPKAPAGVADVNPGGRPRDGGQFVKKDASATPEATPEEPAIPDVELVPEKMRQKLSRRDIERQARLERESRAGIEAVDGLIKRLAAKGAKSETGVPIEKMVQAWKDAPLATKQVVQQDYDERPGKTWNFGCSTTGGRFSKVSVSLPTMRAPCLISQSAASTPGPGESAPA